MSCPAAGPDRPADPTPLDAWSLARALSPHPRVRLADVDEAGAIVNSYPTTVPASGPSPAPDRPYALHLADPAGRYRLLGFDLDAHKGPVLADVARLRELLTRARLPHVVCASGPGGGRHVWVALAQPVTAAVVAGIARGLRSMLPSLDPIPLLNPATGALRPPWAPHRCGRRSEILDGQLTDLLRPVAGPAQVLALAGLVHAAQPAPERTTAALDTTRDAEGHRCLPGRRRELSPRTHAALHTPPPADADTSEVLRAVLCGAITARWHLADIRAHLATAPGLEHLRTAADRTRSRQPRHAARQLAALSEEWDRAVGFVSANPVNTSTDPTFEPRCATVVTAVAAVQTRADAAPGRWARPGGPADRRVLDIACELMLAAVTTDIELAIRTIALRAGIGRTASGEALRRLARDGWLTPAATAAGVHGARWALPTPTMLAEHRTPDELSTPAEIPSRSQVNTRPRDWPPLRSSWKSHLAHRTSAVLHDALTSSGLGHHTARVYQALTTTAVDVLDLVGITGYTRRHLCRLLDRLASHRLAKTDRTGRWRLLGRSHTGGTRLGRAARTLGVLGLLVDRARRYRAERDAWEWWTDELAWRRLPAGQKKRAAGAGQIVLAVDGLDTRDRRGPHPRRAGGRADYAAARRLIDTGTDLADTA